MTGAEFGHEPLFPERDLPVDGDLDVQLVHDLPSTGTVVCRKQRSDEIDQGV